MARPRRPTRPPPADDRARLEFVDVASGQPVEPDPPDRPEADGAAPTGRIVAELEGERVEVDPDDVLAQEGTHPRDQRFDYDPTAYRARAREAALEREELERERQPIRKPRSIRATFDDPKQAAREFYEENAAFFDNVRDPHDGLRDWLADLDTTDQARARVLELVGAPAIRAALALVFGRARGRRWDAVAWRDVEALGEALAPYYESPGEGEPGIDAIYWRPIVGDATPEQLEQLSGRERADLAAWETHEEITLALADLRDALERTRGCLSERQREIVERRIGEWSRWADNPREIPGYACEPDESTGGYTCNYPAIAAELRELRTACERSYDPDWAEPASRSAVPGFPDTSRGPLDPKHRIRAQAKGADERQLADELRLLADDGRAYGASSQHVQTRREIGEVVYQLELRQCGKARCRICNGGGGHGPYWYAYGRGANGRRWSRYIGREFREL